MRRGWHAARAEDGFLAGIDAAKLLWRARKDVSGVCVCVYMYTHIARTQCHMHTVPHTHVRTYIRIRVPVE